MIIRPIMEVGKEFHSYTELQSEVAKFQKDHLVRLYKRDTRTIEATKKRQANQKDFNERIVYSGLKYACVYGGKTFVSQATGLRPNAKTMKSECPFMIRIASSDDGQKLVVKEMITAHNHEVDEALYLGYRSSRKRRSAAQPIKIKTKFPNSELADHADCGETSHIVPSAMPTTLHKSIFIMDRWNGRIAVVTGASSGIGQAVTKALLALGMHVVGCARTIEPIQTLAKELVSQPGTLTAIRCDVSREEDVKSMFKRIHTDPKLGTVHAIINCAGLAHEAPLLSGETSQWRNMLEVNILGLMMCTREAFHLMEETGVKDGHIFLINSMSGHRITPNKNVHFYASTKFAVTALTEGIRNELREKKSNTRVTAISPGLVDTDFFHRMFNDPAKASQFMSSGQFLDAKDVADAVVYALNAPPTVQVHDVLMRSTKQIS